jgi:hypothetical protein
MEGLTMFPKWTAVAALIVSAFPLSAQLPLLRHGPSDHAAYAAQARRYAVQFRQPYWREYTFGSPAEMEIHIDSQRRNGWEVQVFPRELRVRDRLMNWGGSRVFDNAPEAQQWSVYLEGQGYEPRIVVTR